MQGIDFVFSLAVLIMSVVVHEVSHGYVAGMLGDPTARLAGRLTLNPLKHLDPFGSFLLPLLLSLSGLPVFGYAIPVPYNPYNLGGGKWGPALVAAAGPGSNLLIALFFGFLLRIDSGAALGIGFAALAVQIVFVNVSLAVFNSVPIPPLDGSKVLFALLPYQQRGVQEWFERNQYILLFALIFFLWRFIAPLVYFFFTAITGIV